VRLLCWRDRASGPSSTRTLANDAHTERSVQRTIVLARHASGGVNLQIVPLP